jgi:hypothetical protein
MIGAFGRNDDGGIPRFFSAIFMDFLGVFDRAFPGVKRVWIHCRVQYTDCGYFPNFITSLLQHRLVYIALPH